MLTPLQLVLLCVAAFLVLPTINFSQILSGIKSLIAKQTVSNSETNNKSNSNDGNGNNNDDDGFIEIVKMWDNLKDACKKQELTEAVAKLDEIFPVLIKVEKQKGE